MRPTVVAYRPDLLGGRLLNLMHGWRLARRLDADFIHIWPQFSKWREQSGYDEPTAPLSQLFDLAEHMLARPDLRFVTVDSPPLVETVAMAERRLRMLPHTPDDAAAYPFAPTAQDVVAHWPEAGFTACTPFPVRGEAWAAVHDEARALIRTLPLNAQLAAAMTQVREAVDLPGAVAIHLRRGDVAGMLLDVADKDDAFVRQFAGVFVSRYAPEQAYLAALAERPPALVLVFSDSREATAAILAANPRAVDGRALLAPIARATGLTPLQGDCLDVLTMSEAGALLASGSNFAGAAAAYGGGTFADLRGRWSAEAVSQVLATHFAASPGRVIGALFDAFDSYFAGQPQLSAARDTLAAGRTARLAACPA